MHKKTIILSGSGGWLGKATIDNLKDHYNLICLSRNKQFIKQYSGNAVYWDGSNRLKNIIDESIYSNSTLVHTAAYPYSLYRSTSHTLRLAEIIKSELNLFEMLIEKPYPKNIVYVSSSSVHSLETYFSSSQKSSVCRIGSKLGISKFIIEQELINLSQSSNVKFSIIRPQSIFSSDEKPSDKQGHLYSDLIYKILSTKETDISISLPENYLMTMTPEYHYIDILKQEINNISNGNYIELSNKNHIKLGEFIKEVVDYGLTYKILANKPLISYEKINAQQIVETRNDMRYSYCDVEPKKLIKKYLEKYFSRP